MKILGPIAAMSLEQVLHDRAMKYWQACVHMAQPDERMTFDEALKEVRHAHEVTGKGLRNAK